MSKNRSYKLVYPNKEDDVFSNTNKVKLKEVTAFGDKQHNEWHNMLIFGDNLKVLRTLLEEDKIRNKVKLVYIDPPFCTNREFSDSDNNHAYKDKLNGSEYVEFIRKRLILLRDVLSEDGSMYVHLDQKKGHYIKVIMDEVFGEENFINDITRIKCNPKSFDRKGFGNIKDVIYFYAKNKDKMFWPDYKQPLNISQEIKQFPKIDDEGRRYATTPLHAPGETKNGKTGGIWKGMYPPKGRHWRYLPEELTKLDEMGLIEWSSTGNPRKKIYADESSGKKVQDVLEFKDPGFQRQAYPTEKNLELLDLVIQSSSKEGDVILDCFSGSGTTLVSAEKLDRKWVGIDNSLMAIKKSINRLKKVDKLRNFKLYNATTQNLFNEDFQ